MKKLLFVAIALSLSNFSFAQLNGSSYYQDFNNLNSNSLPAGWRVDTGATATSLGNSITPFYVHNTWAQVAGGFKNVASAHGLTSSADSATQAAAPDRALAIRQTSGLSSFHGSDPGAAFIFKIDNTNDLSGFKLEFELQSLDVTSPRYTQWSVDYGLGNTPGSFVSVFASGNTSTGDNTFSTNNINVDFGSALDHQNQPVWIRIIALTSTGGSGTRATTAIDNFQLNWTGTASAVATVTDKAIPVTASRTGDKLLLNYSLTESTTVKTEIFDMAGRKVYGQSFRGNKGNNSQSVSLSLPVGLYTVKVSTANAFGTQKIML